jgi:autotransporter-associated beta strand protein
MNRSRQSAFRRRALYRASFGLLGMLAALPTSGLFAQTTYNASFTGATAGGWVFGANPGDSKPFLTAATGAGGYDGSGNAIGAPLDAVGDGWLRMNTNTGDQSTFALLDTQIFSVNAKIEIQMDYAFWNGSGADGITFFLVDGNINSSTFTPGAYGGSMGYAQRTGEAGMPGGYLGFALDNFGNYSNGSEGRNGGITNDGTLYPNRVSVRGPESSNYAYIASGDVGTQMDFPTYTTRPDQTGADYRSFRIVFDANNQLTVQMKFGVSGSFNNVFTADLSVYDRPDSFKIGFTGATGGSTEIHELRNVSVTTTPWSSGSGAYEWDNGAGTTTWGTQAGGEANTNWYSSVPADDNKTPIQKSDVLFGDKPTNNGTNNTQSVQLGNNVDVRNLTFDTGINYTIGTVGAGRTINLGKDSSGLGLPSINVNDYNGAYALHKINADLNVTENLAIRNFSFSTLCINGTTETNGKTITVSGTGAVNFNGDISGSGNLVKNSTAIATINNDNSNDPDGAGPLTAWSGNVSINSGMLVVTASGALGDTTGTTTVDYDATLAFRGGVTYTNAESVTLFGNGITRSSGQLSGAIHNDGGNNSFAGNLTLGSNVSIGSRADNLTLSGTITDGASTFSLTKVGPGVVTLSNTGNTYNGATIIQEGALRLTGANLPAGTNSAVQLNGGVLEYGFGSPTITLGTGGGQIQFTGDGGFSAFGANRTVGTGTTLTWASTANFLADGKALLLSSEYSNAKITFTDALGLGGTTASLREIRVANGSAAVDGELNNRIRGNGGILKTGTGTLELSRSGSSNDYSGVTQINGGALRISNVNALSTNSRVVLNGGVLEIGADLNGGTAGDYSPTLGTAATNLGWAGDGGFSASAAARSVTIAGGGLTWGAANFVANSNALIFGSTSTDNTVTLTNALALGASGNRTIRTVQGTATLPVGLLSGVVSGAANLSVTGNARLDLTAANTNTGNLTLVGAEVRLTSTATGNGTMLSAAGYTIQQGGRLTLDNSANFIVTDRLSNTAPVSLAGGRLDFIGSANTTTSTETIGAITLSSGENQINVQRSGTSTATLTAASLTRVAGATLEITNEGTSGTLGAGGTNPGLIFTTAPTLERGILAYAVVGNSTTATGFATHTGNGTQVTSNVGTNTAVASWNSSIIAAPTTSQALTANATVGALVLGSNIGVSGAFTLTADTGGILTTGTGNNTISTTALQVGGSGSRELITHVYGTSNLTISSAIQNNSNTTGLTKAGPGTLVLSGTGNNTYTGQTIVNAGTLTLNKTAGVNAIAGDGNTTTTDLIVGDGRGTDTLRLAANDQIADNVNVSLRGGEVGNSANVARFEMNGAVSNTDSSRSEKFRSLDITGNSVLDFGGGTVCSPNFLYLDFLTVNANSQLTITNWLEFTDFLLVKKTTFDESQLARIIFDGYPGTAKWQNYDDDYYQIAPVPEPSAYGAIAFTLLGGFYATRRRRRAPLAAVSRAG